MSTAQAINNSMEGAWDKLGDIMHKAMTTPVLVAQIPPAPAVVAPAPVVAAPPPALTIFTMAVSTMTSDADFTMDEMDDTVDLFLKNSAVADMYLAIKDASMRTRFLHRRLNESQAEKMYGIRMD
jgi:hypothetical protein